MVECVVSKAHFGGACTNCQYHSVASQCSIRPGGRTTSRKRGKKYKDDVEDARSDSGASTIFDQRGAALSHIHRHHDSIITMARMGDRTPGIGDRGSGIGRFSGIFDPICIVLL
ncbi:hypothetical protein CONLIGDRAFT_684973 [Coniochaeta ligniaria NRRL 30616]|uniref:Uncharacterized protein n=1 Tax=Coniochaeta ligniaria NRRL 30616 TaxID=1408157 RepID=A0A1J7ICT9_9PEZI|nr:hypothetical protein CONLIGDRAFT_684973 [Coniochaeta ligniaria NRRL 30616]